MKKLNESELFEIGLHDLRDLEVFPFHLYVYNPKEKIYSIYLEANTPLTDQKLTFIQYMIQRKGRLAVSKRQKLTFLNHMNITEADIPSLAQDTDKEEEQIEINNEVNIVIDFDFEDEFTKADLVDDYSRIISAMKKEVSSFSPKISHTVSLATYLVKELCHEDNLTNRTVALSYFLSKQINIKEPAALADIVVAAFFCHIGYTQMDMKLSSTPQLLMGDQMNKEHQKHLGLSQHLVRKSGVEISMRCQKIINEHHERVDGNGYPNKKSTHQVEPLALVLGLASHLIEFSYGKIDGNKQRILPLIKVLETQERKPGLEIHFGEYLIESLVSIIKDEFSENVA